MSLLPASCRQGKQASLSKVDDACRIAERIDGALALGCRTEIAVIPDLPDFFGTESGMSKARTLMWKTVQATSSLRWAILTRKPENICKETLPDGWRNGARNACLGLVIDNIEDLSGKLDILRGKPARYRMLLITAPHPDLDLGGKLDGIHWVVFCGHEGDASLSERLRKECEQAGAAFLFHRLDRERGSDDPAHEQPPGADDETAWPDQPFGPLVQLKRPTLKPVDQADDAPVQPQTPEGSPPLEPTELPEKSNPNTPPKLESPEIPDEHHEPPRVVHGRAAL